LWRALRSPFAFSIFLGLSLSIRTYAFISLFLSLFLSLSLYPSDLIYLFRHSRTLYCAQLHCHIRYSDIYPPFHQVHCHYQRHDVSHAMLQSSVECIIPPNRTLHPTPPTPHHSAFHINTSHFISINEPCHNTLHISTTHLITTYPRHTHFPSPQDSCWRTWRLSSPWTTHPAMCRTQGRTVSASLTSGLR
jgi:hypothetical protein